MLKLSMSIIGNLNLFKEASLIKLIYAIAFVLYSVILTVIGITLTSSKEQNGAMY